MFNIRLCVTVAVLGLAFGCPIIAEEVVKESTAESRILETIKYLADDDRDGRGIGTEGIEEAAEYLANQFREMGLETELFDGGPFQEFTTRTGVSSGEEGETHLSFVASATKADESEKEQDGESDDGDENEEKDGEASEDESEEEEESEEDEKSDASGEAVDLELGIDFNSLAVGGSGEFDAELVFAGYGITAEDLKYDDYADVDFEGLSLIHI